MKRKVKGRGKLERHLNGLPDFGARRIANGKVKWTDDSVMMTQTSKTKANPMFNDGYQESGEEFVVTNF